MSETVSCKESTLKEYEAFFNSISLSLYKYAYFVSQDKENAGQIVSCIFPKGYESVLFSGFSSKNMISLLAEELLKSYSSDKELSKCAAYLYFKERFHVKEIAELFCCETDEIKALLLSFKKEAESLSKAE